MRARHPAENKVHTLSDLGVTRLSLGVENYTDEILRRQRARPLVQQVYTAWDWIQAADFHNVNIDLISGMVGETWDNWQYSIQDVIEMCARQCDDLSDGTAVQHGLLQGRPRQTIGNTGRRLADEAAWVDQAFDQFLAAGYSVSSAYTLVKDPKRVASAIATICGRAAICWRPASPASGTSPAVHYQNRPEWEDYCGMLENGKLPLGRGLTTTPHGRLVRELILLLKRGYLDGTISRRNSGRRARQVAQRVERL